MRHFLKYLMLYTFVLVSCDEELKKEKALQPKTSFNIYENSITASQHVKHPDFKNIKVYFNDAKIGKGKTSIRFSNNKKLKKTNNTLKNVTGYYIRDRDLGQTFTVRSKDFTLEHITVQTTDSLFPKANGTKLFIQLFEVVGEPKLNDNKTLEGPVVKWTNAAWADDFFQGEDYISMGIYKGARLPDSLMGRHYVRFTFHDHQPVLKKNQRYAFIVGFEEAGPDRYFVLAGRNRVNAYKDGHGIRREAKGSVPVPNDLNNSTFPDFMKRIAMTPTSRGFPDVDTFRDFVFFIEGSYINDVN